MICIWLSANHSSRFDNRTKVVLSENSSATGSETCCARIGRVKSTGARGLPKSFVSIRFQMIPSISELHLHFGGSVYFWSGPAVHGISEIV